MKFIRHLSKLLMLAATLGLGACSTMAMASYNPKKELQQIDPDAKAKAEASNGWAKAGEEVAAGLPKAVLEGLGQALVNSTR